MQDSANTNHGMNESYDEQRAHELVKLGRWIGEHEKARELGRNLCLSERRDCILAAPGDTD